MVFAFLISNVFGSDLVVFCKVLVGGHSCNVCFVSYLSCSIVVPQGCILCPCFGFNYCCKGEAFRRDAFGSLSCGCFAIRYVTVMFPRVRDAAC